MEKKTYTQFGTFSIVVLSPILIFSLVMLIITGSDDLIMGATFGFMSLILAICLLIFYKLTISIDNTHLSFKLGIGIVSKKYLIADIATCKPVVNDPFYGVGIRLISGGWLYNVSGLHAIELTFKNHKSRIRIGTDKPDEIASLLNKMIGTEKPGSSSDYTNKSNLYLIIILVFLSLIIPAAIVFSGKREIKTSATDSDFSLLGMYGLTIKYSEINRVDTISALPEIRRRTNGYAFGKTLKGNFILKDKTRVKLFITNDTAPYIFIRTDDLNIYINLKTRGETIELFSDFKKRSRAVI